MNLALRSYSGAVAMCRSLLDMDVTPATEYSKTARALGPLVDGPYRRFFRYRLVGEIAPDFCLPSLGALRLENEHRDCPECELGKVWWLFATAGNGDGWLLRKGGAEVAFLDHSDESGAKPRSLDIAFDDWVRLAVLMHDVERLVALNPNLLDRKRYRLLPDFGAEVRARMSELNPSLGVKFPFDI